MPVEVIGIDHVYVTVRDLARSTRFYDGVMSVLGYKKLDAPIGRATRTVALLQPPVRLLAAPGRGPARPRTIHTRRGLHPLLLPRGRRGERSIGPRASWSRLGVGRDAAAPLPGVLGRLLRDLLRGPRRDPARAPRTSARSAGGRMYDWAEDPGAPARPSGA